MYKRIFLLLFFASFSAQASHLLGGEIAYRCLGNGLYRFTVVLYRDCSGIPLNLASVNLDGPVPVSCALVASYDITPRGPSPLGTIRCTPPSTYAATKGGIGKFVYEGTADLSALAPAPVGGYTWVTNSASTSGGIPCCRNTSINSNCNGDLILRATMYRFMNADGYFLTPAQICDNSPLLQENPVAVTITNPLDTAVINNSAQDVDLADHLRYYIDYPWTGNGVPCNYNQGYTQANPLPGLIGTAIDSISGLIRYRPTVTGSFQTAIRVESRRCGQKIAEVFRDFQLNIIPNPAGSRPVFNPNASASDQLYQQKAPFLLPFRADTTNRLAYNIEMYVNDTLQLPLQAYDIYPLFDPANPPSVPLPAANPDEVSLFVTGAQIGANGTSATSGCLYPPCATISQASGNPPTAIRYFTGGELLGFGYSSEQTVGAQLNWVPQCDNLPDSGCSAATSTFNFAVTAFDDNSPIRGKSSQIYTVRLKALPEIAAPVFRQLSLDPTAASATLSWSVYFDSTSIDPIDQANLPNASQAEKLARSVERRRRAFGGIEVERASQVAGPFVVVANFTELANNTWVDTSLVSGQVYYYRIATLNSCTGKRNYSDVLKTIRLVFGHDWATGTAQLSWDSLAINSLVPDNFTGQILVERENYTVQPGLWQLRGSSFMPLTQYSEIPQTFGDSLNFRIGFEDSSALISYSQAFGSTFDLDALSIESSELSKFQIYPNPVDQQLHLKLAENVVGKITINVNDVSGKLVLKKQFELTNTALISVDVALLSPGVYHMQVQRENQFIGGRRFVKR